MPAVSGHLSFQLSDGNKVPVSFSPFFTAGSGLLADIQSAVTTYAPLLDAVTQSQILKADAVIPLSLPGGLKAAPVSGSNNNIAALLKYLIALPQEYYSYWVANWIPAGFQAAHQNLVDQSQANVAAFLAAMLATTNTLVFTDEDGNDLSALQKATKSVRKDRRALGRVR